MAYGACNLHESFVVELITCTNVGRGLLKRVPLVDGADSLRVAEETVDTRADSGADPLGVPNPRPNRQGLGVRPLLRRTPIWSRETTNGVHATETVIARRTQKRNSINKKTLLPYTP